MLIPSCRGAAKRVLARTSPAVLAALSLAAAAAPAAHAATTVSSAPAEAFTIPSSGATVFTDANAEGTKATNLYANASISKSVSLPSAADTVVMRVRGDQCNGAPAFSISIDGAVVKTGTIAATTYTTTSVATSLGAGTHTVKVSFTNDYLQSGVCDRNLRVDTVSFLSSATTSSIAPSSTPKLRWSPPALTSPTTIHVAGGDQWLTLDTSKDYIIDLGSTPHYGAVVLDGGHNVVVKGGQISLPMSSGYTVGMSIRNNVGTVHVEGVLFDGSLGKEMDGIQIVAPNSTVQVENVRATHLVGSYSTNHTDIIQPWGGVKDLRVDRLSGDTNYQGLFLRPDQGPIGSIELQNIDLNYDNVGAQTGGYLVWMTTGCSMAPTTLSNVYVDPKVNWSLGKSVWPDVQDSRCPATLSGNTVNWSKTRLPVSGYVTLGPPANGDYVPDGLAGASYASPGYL
jgi:hypothetical protein